MSQGPLSLDSPSRASTDGSRWSLPSIISHDFYKAISPLVADVATNLLGRDILESNES